MSEGPLGRIERGVNAPSASVIYRLAKVLGVSVNALFADPEEDLRATRFEGKQDPFLVTTGKEDAPLPGRVQSTAADIIEAFQALDVFDYFELFENQGFRVVVLPMPKDIDSFSYYDPPCQNAFFFLNARKNPERQLFSLAYELGRVFILTYTMQQGIKLFASRDEKRPDSQKRSSALNIASAFPPRRFYTGWKNWT
jgi:transcriptional regulator with XRE-family HTH domain